MDFSLWNKNFKITDYYYEARKLLAFDMSICSSQKLSFHFYIFWVKVMKPDITRKKNYDKIYGVTIAVLFI